MYKSKQVYNTKEIDHNKYMAYGDIIDIEDAVKMFEKRIEREMNGHVYYKEYYTTENRRRVKKFFVYIHDEEYFKKLKEGVTYDK